MKNTWHPATVVKIPAHHNLEIFDEHFFECYMRSKKELGYNDTANCIKLCTIRISFIKGWGERYRRQVLTGRVAIKNWAIFGVRRVKAEGIYIY